MTEERERLYLEGDAQAIDAVLRYAKSIHGITLFDLKPRLVKDYCDEPHA